MHAHFSSFEELKTKYINTDTDCDTIIFNMYKTHRNFNFFIKQLWLIDDFRILADFVVWGLY